MATRPAWCVKNVGIVRESFDFHYNSGFSDVQKKKNVKALHESIGKSALEVSTKSDNPLGFMLSAFNLKLDGIPFECVFQASKKYSNGGPYLDLLKVSPKEAKRDERHQTSGNLTAFVYKGEEFLLIPRTFFYDYMYIKAVKQSVCSREIKKILNYEYFTDIEFNPKKSINCQAKSVAIIKAMLQIFGEIPELNRKDFYFFYELISAEKY